MHLVDDTIRLPLAFDGVQLNAARRPQGKTIASSTGVPISHMGHLNVVL